jgi:uncharacterized protein
MTAMVDLAHLVAIDTHVHVQASVTPGSSSNSTLAEMSSYFGTEMGSFTTAQIASYYRERKMACVVFRVDRAGESDDNAPSNEEIARIAADNPDVLIPFASVDPARGAEGVDMVHRLADDFGIRGVKFHPNVQGFFPNDPAVYPLYEAIAQHDLIALFHTGHTGVGAGVRGGRGIRLKFSNPMSVDDVAVDFPDLRIILAHPSFPWQDEALSVALHKPNVYIDLSGWSPKYFPPQLVQYANTLLKKKMLFGSDFPAITPDRWLADFDRLDIKPEVKPMILKENAARLLGLRMPNPTRSEGDES